MVVVESRFTPTPIPPAIAAPDNAVIARNDAMR
jgi:hypothetical protein